jgi:hypothetical protein
VKFSQFAAGAVLALAAVGILPQSASAEPITYTFTATSLVGSFYPLVSATGSFTLDSSAFSTLTPPPNDQAVDFSAFTAFNFVFVTDVSGTDVTDTFTLAEAQAEGTSGVLFDVTTNPPAYYDGNGNTASDGVELLVFEPLSIEIFGEVAGGYNEQADGSFSAAALPVTGVPEPITLSLFGAGLAGVAVVRRRKRSKQV